MVKENDVIRTNQRDWELELKGRGLPIKTRGLGRVRACIRPCLCMKLGQEVKSIPGIPIIKIRALKTDFTDCYGPCLLLTSTGAGVTPKS